MTDSTTHLVASEEDWEGKATKGTYREERRKGIERDIIMRLSERNIFG